MRIRVIDQRYGTDPAGFDTDRAGNKISTYDKPLWNKSTDQPLINGGSFARFDKENPDPKQRKMKQYMPGTVLDIPDEEAEQLLATCPNVLEKQSEYEARMKRIEEKRKPKQGAEYELASFMEQTTADDVAARNLRLLQEEKRLRDIQGLGIQLHPGHDKDLIAQLMAQMQKQQAEIDALKAKPAGQT